MKVTPLDITITLVGCGVILLITLLFIFIWKKQTNGLLRWVGVGAITWFIAVIVKGTIGTLLNEHIMNFIKSLMGHSGYVIVGSIWLGLLTGSTEIYFGYLIAKNRKYISFNQGSGYGLGFGVIEATLMVIAFALIAIVEIFMPGSLPKDVVGLLANSSWPDIGAGSLQRILAFIIHIASGVLIVYSLASKNIIYFWIAFVYKSTVDEIAGSMFLAGIATKNPWLLDVFFIPFSLFGIWIIIKLYKKWPVTLSTN